MLNSVNFTSDLKSTVTVVFCDHEGIKRIKSGANSEHVSESLEYFTAHAQKPLFRSFQSKI